MTKHSYFTYTSTYHNDLSLHEVELSGNNRCQQIEINWFNDLSLHKLELSSNNRCQQIEINSYPDSPLLISERSTLAQLRSGYCRLLGSYNIRIKKDACLNVCADCGMMPHDVKYLFVCPAHPTTMRPSDLWSRPTDAIRVLNYLEARDPD